MKYDTFTYPRMSRLFFLCLGYGGGYFCPAHLLIDSPILTKLSGNVLLGDIRLTEKNRIKFLKGDLGSNLATSVKVKGNFFIFFEKYALYILKHLNSSNK